MATCAKSITDATKGLVQRDVKGSTKDFFFLTVGSPQRSWQNLQ